MSQHKKLSDIQDIKEQEIYLEKLIKNQHDNELRAKWESMIDRDKSKAQITKSKNTLLKMLLAVGLISLLFFLALQLMPKKQSNPKQFALLELSAPINHPGLTKGNLSDRDSRTNAIIQFNNQDFASAIESFKHIETTTSEDAFYLAMSYLYNKEFDRSINMLTPISNSESILSQEAKWYLAVAHILNNSHEEAQLILKQIKPTEWKYKEAQDVLRNIEH